MAELGALTAWIERQASTEASAATPSSGELRAAIARHLLAAQQATDGKTHWWQVRREGARLQRAMSNLDAAESDILRIAPAAFVLGEMPSVLNQLRRYLAEDDPRRRQIEAIAKSLNVNEPDKPPTVVQGDGDPRLVLIEQERGTLVAGLRGANSAALREQMRLQSFRSVVVITTIAMAIVAIGLALFGWASPEAVPLCFAPEDGDVTTVVCPTHESEPFLQRTSPLDVAAGSETGAGTTADSGATVPAGDGDQQSQPDSSKLIDDQLKATASPVDIALVELIGLTAAAVAAAGAIRRVRGSSEPYGIPIALALLKLPTGAVTAFLGLLLMRGGFVPGLSALDSSAQILAWAIIFGYAQQLFTGLVDQKAHSVLNEVRGGAE